MSKRLMNALVVCLSLTGGVVAPALAATDGTGTETGAPTLASIQAEIENLIVLNAGDPDALEAAIQSLIENSPDPLLATQAALAALSSPTSVAAQNALAGNAALKSAGGKGIGAAIASIGVSNPGLADNMQTAVANSGDTTLQTSVSDGQQTAGLGGDDNSGDSDTDNANNESETPETPPSAS